MRFQNFILFAAIVFAAPSWSGEWLNNLEQAKQQAIKEKKSILLFYHANEWNASKELKKQVLTSPEFQQAAEDKLVLVELDFPKQITEEKKKYNWSITKQYPVDGFPTVYLLDAWGNAYWMKSGASAKATYLSELNKGFVSKNSVLKWVIAAQQDTGLEKAKKLDMALRTMPDDLREANSHLTSQIVALDPQDTLGYGKKQSEHFKNVIQPKIQRAQERAINEFGAKTLTPLIQAKRFDDGLAQIAQFLQKDDWSVTSRQSIFLLSSQIYLLKMDIDKSLAVLQEIVDLNATSEQGKQAASTILTIKQNREALEKELKRTR